MELSIKENGSSKKARKMAEVFKFGLMALGMMDSGETEWQMDMDV